MTIIKDNYSIYDLLALKNNDGATLRNGKSIRYASGYQVATEGIATKSIMQAHMAVKAYGGNCGIWLEDGTYYIDKCHRVATKKQAISEGKAHNQISVLGWKKMDLIYMSNY